MVETGPLIALPIERDALERQLGAAMMEKIKLVGYTNAHKILVRFWDNSAMEFEIDEWLSDLCIARLALECP
jgi:hypothetical protein